MKVPGAERAFVDPAKVRDYLLSPAHPVGRFKAQVFLSLGYTQLRWDVLVGDLLQHVRDGLAEETAETRYGRKFRVRGMLVGPNGRRALFASIWLLRHDAEGPRLLTAFPD